MVYTSQVLEYLQELKKNPGVEEVGLVLFRHEKNIFKKKEVETRALQYVDWVQSFSSLPVLSVLQLRMNALKARHYVCTKFSKEQKVAVICRGELATVVGSIAFNDFDNVRILYDNRGLPVLESEMSYPNQLIHKINRKKKYWAMLYAKDHCDMYNFVTNAMRDFDIDTYKYKRELPYTIIPTLYKPSYVDEMGISEIRKRENYNEDDLIISYVGATQAWQSADELVHVIGVIGKKYPSAKFLLLTNGKLDSLNKLDENVRNRVTKKTVPHSDMPYYLAVTDIGIVIRDDNIVNRVAAPTKIAEYITNGISILYKGHIGVLDDLKRIEPSIGLIDISDNGNWLNQVGRASKKPVVKQVLDYFDMTCRQDETIQMIERSFSQPMMRGR